ncbi:MAG: DNA polymerase III subunit gamma/tau [Candidatus Aphodosoma sp.]
MSQYIVSARKYRPQTFRSVVGQDALTTTLKNAIANNHLAHAYLFCGPRGVGKTTCARIFAKTINCLNPGKDGEACNECESCMAFNEQRSFNIHELDAASNNSVEDIRSLVEQVQIPPQIGHYSVYIIDEVHMLSSAAFNAFLKTLEEPPAHAIFILATTEKHKIIPTILSRCQIYDFNRIRISDTINHLKYVAENENIQVEEAALNIIARKADGAMRDALSIFDQVVSFCGQTVTYQNTIENLNVLDYDYYFQLVDLLLEARIPETLVILDTILSKGFDGQHFVSGFASHLRDIMVSKAPETLPLLEVGDTIAPKYQDQASRCPTEWIYRALEMANDCDLQYRNSKNKRLLTELMLIRIAGLKTNGTSKKAEPELPYITAVAPSPVLDTTQATAQPQAKPVTTGNKMPVIRLNIQRTGNPPAPAATTPAPQKAQQSMPDSPAKQHHTPQPFTEERLKEEWIRYARSIEKEAHTTNAMLNFPPEKIDDSHIAVRLINSIQVEMISSHRKAIEQYLSEKLSNDISLGITLDATIAKDKAFTPDEKLKRMQESNAAFNSLKTALGLEII